MQKLSIFKPEITGTGTDIVNHLNRPVLLQPGFFLNYQVSRINHECQIVSPPRGKIRAAQARDPCTHSFIAHAGWMQRKHICKATNASDDYLKL